MFINNSLWSFTLVSQFYRLGVRHFCVAPGSRSAALSLALFRLKKQHSDLYIHTHFDERGLGFFALNLAKVNAAAVVVVTTSGTAVANLYPAVIEAYETRVPLLVVSADRPDRLLNCGANQAIAQKNLFNHYVRLNLNFTLPDTSAGLTKQLDAMAKLFSEVDAIGPAQINCQFDEPLYPSEMPPCDFAAAELNEFSQTPDLIGMAKFPSDSYRNGDRYTDGDSDKSIAELQQKLRDSSNCLVVLGGLTPAQYRQLYPWLAELKGLVIADVTSQFRFEGLPNILHYADLLLAKGINRETFHPDLILQFGGRLVSKRLNQWLAEICSDYCIVLEAHQNLDPTGRANRYTLDYSRWVDRIDTRDVACSYDQVNALLANNREMQQWIKIQLQLSWHEASICYRVATELVGRNAVFAGNSLAIRMLDSFSAPTNVDTRISVFSNRGASGIDGLLASAAAIGYGDYDCCVAFVGDTSFLHDINSLALIAKSPAPLKIIVLNNDGGGIFSLLPASEEESFETLFLMPHGREFNDAARLFGIAYQRADSIKQLNRILPNIMAQPGAAILECVIPQGTGTTQLKALLAELKLAV